MSQDVEARIARLLDQLEKPGISEAEAQRIQRRIEYLQGSST